MNIVEISEVLNSILRTTRMILPLVEVSLCVVTECQFTMSAVITEIFTHLRYQRLLDTGVGEFHTPRLHLVCRHQHSPP